MHPAKIKNLLELNHEERYEYFIREVVQIEEVWTVANSEGYLMIKDEAGDVIFPIWPNKELAEICSFAEHKELGSFAEKIEYNSFVENCIPDMIKDNNSFEVNDIELAFVSLCIALETIIPDKEQLTYRFRRNIAVLCADKIDFGRLIMDNVNKLYKYRSKIIHSAMKTGDYKNLPIYYKYARVLCSRVIIEMIIHNVPTIKELDQHLTESGLGNGHSITEDYSEFKGNIFAWREIIIADLPK